jgi:hypothetical protein
MIAALCIALTGCEYTTSGNLQSDADRDNEAQEKPSDNELSFDMGDLADSKDIDIQGAEPVFTPPFLDPSDDEEAQDEEDDFKDNEDTEDDQDDFEDNQDNQDKEDKEDKEDNFEPSNCQPCTGDFSVETPDSAAAIDGCSTIKGDLSVTNLAEMPAMECLEVIRGNLTIESTQLEDIAGRFPNLAEVQGDFSIRKNVAMTTIGSMPALRQVGGELRIESNEAMRDMTGLEQLDYIGKDMLIHRNPTMLRINKKAGEATAGNNKDEDDISLDIWGSLYITENDLLDNTQGIDRVAFVGKSFEVTQNPSLCAAELDKLADEVAQGEVIIEENAEGCK